MNTRSPQSLHHNRWQAFCLLVLLAGCQPVMTTSAPQDNPMSRSASEARWNRPARPYTGTVADWPLFFVKHDFHGLCWNTQRCSIRYHGFEHGSEGPTPEAPTFPDGYDDVLGAVYGGVQNFPPPAQVRWRSKDGTELHAEVDIAALFKEGQVVHQVPREEIPDGIGISDPEIVVEVNDRTINVYTRTYIPTKTEQIPGNKYSTHRDDLFKVYSRTY